MAFLTITRCSVVKGRRSRKLGPTYTGRGFAKGLGAVEGLASSAFDRWGVDLVESGGLGDVSSKMDVIGVSGEETSTRELEPADTVDNFLELELAGDPGGVDDFSAAKTKIKSASCKPVCQYGSRKMALLLLSKWAMAAFFPDVSGSGLSHSDALSSKAWSADASLSGASLSGASLSGASLSGASLSGASLSDASLSGASSCRASSSDAFGGRDFS